MEGTTQLHVVLEEVNASSTDPATKTTYKGPFSLGIRIQSPVNSEDVTDAKIGGHPMLIGLYSMDNPTWSEGPELSVGIGSGDTASAVANACDYLLGAKEELEDERGEMILVALVPRDGCLFTVREYGADKPLE